VKNIFVECRNEADKTVHLGCNDCITITVNSRVGEDSIKVGEIIVAFSEGVCKVVLYDENRIAVGVTEMDISTKEEKFLDE